MGEKALGRGTLAMILSVTMMWSGCSTNWIKQAREIVSVLIPASTNVVMLAAALQGKSVPADELATVEKAGTEVAADLQLIGVLLEAYETADEASKPGILKHIQNVISVTEKNLQEVMQGMHIKDPDAQSKIRSVVGILLAEVQSLAAILPQVQGQGTGARAQRGRGAC